MSGNDLIKSRADAAVLSHDFALAARLYNTLLQQSPDDVKLLEKLGSIYVKSGNDQKALPFYLKVNELKPNDFATLNSLGGIYRRLKKYEDSVTVLKQARALNKDIAQVDYNLGFTYKFMEKYDEAVECFESAIQLNPSDVLAYNHLGAIHQKRGETQQAITTYQKGLKVDCNHPVLHLNLAKSYEKENQIKSAIAEYEAALRSKPGWADALADYSKLLIRLNRTKEAKELVRQSLILNPRNYKMYALNGNILLAQCDYLAAIEEYKKALAFDPVSKRALSGLANALEENGNAVSAYEYIEKVLKMSPNDPELLKRSASIAIGANRLNAAGAKLKTLLNADSEDVEVLDLAGQYYIVKKESDKAENFYRRINTLNPDYVKFMFHAARRYKQIGKVTNAEHSLRRYLGNNPNDSKAFTELGALCEELQKTDEALTNYKKAIAIDPNNAFARRCLERMSSLDDALKNILGQEIEEYDAEAEKKLDEEMKAAEEAANKEVPEEEKPEESLIDEEASSTDSDLWKSESWDPDAIVDENQDPFAALDGDDESILTGPGGTPIEQDEEMPEDIPEDKPNPAYTPLETLANKEPDTTPLEKEADDLFDRVKEDDDEDYDAGLNKKKKPEWGDPDKDGFDDLDDFPEVEDQHEEKPSKKDKKPKKPVDDEPSLDEEPSLDDDLDFGDGAGSGNGSGDGLSDDDDLGFGDGSSGNGNGGSGFGDDDLGFGDDGAFDEPYIPEQPRREPPQEPYQPPYQPQVPPYQPPVPPYEPKTPSYTDDYQPPRQEPYNGGQSGLSASDNQRLMDSMLRAQDEANRAMSAAEKAWDAATKAADAAQIASDSENALTDMAQDAVSEAAEKLKVETEALAKEAAERAAEAAAEKAAAEAAEKALADKLDMIDASLEKFEKMLDEKDDIPEDEIEELSSALKLFQSLRALGESLPENEKHNFLQSKNRLRMDYVIGKLSGHKGLLETAQTLRDSGKLKTFVREEEVPVSYKGKRLAFDVLQNIKEMTNSLNDDDLSIGVGRIISGFNFD